MGLFIELHHTRYNFNYNEYGPTVQMRNQAVVRIDSLAYLNQTILRLPSIGHSVNRYDTSHLVFKPILLL